MAYLICMAHPDYPNTDVSSIVVSQRYPKKAPEYADVKAALEKVYPGKTVYNPLEHCRGGLVHSAYLSPNKQGEGRIVWNFQLWSVK